MSNEQEDKKLSWLGRILRHQFGPSMLLASGLGLVFAWSFLRAFGTSCAGDPSGGWWSHYVCHEGSRSIWTAVSGIAAAPAFLLVWYWRTVLRNQDVVLAQQNHRLALQSLANERFAKAIQLLADGDMSARLGAIYALEQLGRDSGATYYETVAETVSAFLREKSPMQVARSDGDEPKCTVEALPTDVQAAVSVLGRLRPPDGVRPLRLDLRLVHLEGAYLRGAILDRFRLRGANLRGANLTEASLRATSLRVRSGTSKPRPRELLRGAVLDHASLIRSDLTGADLRRASLREAILKDTVLRDARLEGADLQGAMHLTQAQLDLAYGDDDTRLPEGLRVGRRSEETLDEEILRGFILPT